MPQRQPNPEAVSLCSRPPSPSSSNEQGLKKLELDQHPQLADKRGWLPTLLIQSACFLWLLPIIVLLTLNFKHHIVGASAWCPDRDCYVGWFNPVRSVPLQNLRSFDKRDHNLLGALQFVAKALEIWFSLIAAALVYLITFLIAGKRDGLPIGYLTRPSEFSNLPGLLDPLLWRTLPFASSKKGKAESARYRLRIYFFISFTIFLCLVCNLMGPATAVLALPSLQWITTPMLEKRRFAALNSRDPPSLDTLGPFSETICTAADVENLDFSCTAEPFASKLDTWIESYLASGDYNYGVGQQEGVTFGVNQTFTASSPNVLAQTYSDLTWWVPNRQLLSRLSYDYVMMRDVSFGYDEGNQTVSDTLDLDTYAEYNRSVQMIIQRNGPTIGAKVQYYIDFDRISTSISTVDDSRQVRCYRDYNINASPLNPYTLEEYYTKCVRVGHGWSTDNKEAAFSIRGVQDYNADTSAPDIDVEIFTSDKAAFFKNNVLPSWLPSACIESGPVSSSINCDWDRIFGEPDVDLLNRTQNVVTIEMTQAGKLEGLDVNFTLSVDFVAFLNFTTYTLDPSPLTNPMTLVQTLDLPKTGEAITVDPSWVLAAWSVDNGGALNPDRTAAIEMVRSMDGMMKNETQAYANVHYMILLPVVEALSLIDFTADANLAAGVSSANANTHYPILTRNAKLYVWAYGLGSRTSKLGVVVVLLGVVVVLAQLVLGFIDRRKYRSPTQLLVAALEHTPSNEFANVEHNEAKVARMRFHVQGTMTNAGKYAFKKMAARS
ncbi:hypothetical protein Q7P35_009534 [Cladosporium inversicolor]